MKLAIRIIGILFGFYILIVVAFESLLGYYQPQSGNTIVITTYDGEGADRVVTELASNGQRYIAVNHWPRAWYYRLLDNPRITVTKDEITSENIAISVEGEEHDRVQANRHIRIVFRLLTGFPHAIS